MKNSLESSVIVPCLVFAHLLSRYLVYHYGYIYDMDVTSFRYHILISSRTVHYTGAHHVDTQHPAIRLMNGKCDNVPFLRIFEYIRWSSVSRCITFSGDIDISITKIRNNR